MVIHSVYLACLTSTAAELTKKFEATFFVTSYLEAWNERNASSVKEHLRPNGRYIDEVFQQQISREALFEELIDYFQSDHYFYEATGDILTNGKTIAFQYCAQPMGPDSQKTICTVLSSLHCAVARLWRFETTTRRALACHAASDVKTQPDI